MRYFAFFCLLLLFTPVYAIDEVTSSEYPTLAALDNTVIPIADRTDLAQRFLGVRDIPPTPSSVPTRTLGERQAFNISQTLNGTSGRVEAELRAIGEHVYVWLDDSRLISDAEAERFAARFDSEVYEQTRAFWGSEAIPGIDGDARVYALFTGDIIQGIAAYFAGQNSYSRLVFPISNEHDMMIFNLNAFERLDDDKTISVTAHEFQHMIRSHIDSNEEAWVDEGFSMVTEYLLGYPIDDVTGAFLTSTHYQLNTWGLNGNRAADYGAAALFWLYLRQRFGDTVLQQVSDHPANGLQAVDVILREIGAGDVDSFFADWVVANAVDSAAPYGYSNDNFLATPRRIQVLPANFTRELSQYGTHYYSIGTIPENLTVSLLLPETAQLMDFEREGMVFYSNRGDDSNTRLTRAFDLSDVTDSASLAYDLWFEIESGWDYAYVSISTDGGATWDIQHTPMTTRENPYEKAYGSGYTSVSVGWRRDRVILDDYIGQAILVRFELITDDALNNAGLALDNIELEAIDYSADFENDDGGWVAEGWLRTDNRLPQSAWLQVIQRQDDAITLSRWQVSGEAQFNVPIAPDAEQVIIAISPFAPVTTEDTTYTLVVE